jgi:hypothetical protein
MIEVGVLECERSQSLSPGRPRARFHPLLLCLRRALALGDLLAAHRQDQGSSRRRYWLAISVTAATRPATARRCSAVSRPFLCAARRLWLFLRLEVCTLFIQVPPVAGETALARIDVEEHQKCDRHYRERDHLCAVNLAKKRLRIDRGARTAISMSRCLSGASS